MPRPNTPRTATVAGPPEALDCNASLREDMGTLSERLNNQLVDVPSPMIWASPSATNTPPSPAGIDLRVDETPERPVFYHSTGSPTSTLRVDPSDGNMGIGSLEGVCTESEDYVSRRREAYESFATKMREIVTELGVQPLTGPEADYTPTTLLVTLLTAGEPAVTYSVLDIIRAFLVTRGGTTHGRR